MRRIGIALSVVGLLGLVSAAESSAQTTNWLGGSGDWTDAASWDNGVPTAGSVVQIDDGNATASDVALNTATVIDSMTLDAGDLLRIGSGRVLEFQGLSSTLANDGLIQHEGAGNAWLSLSSGLTISGAGTIRLNGGNNQINGLSLSNPLLTNGASHTIEGAGSVGSRIGIANQGLIHANVSGQSLSVGSSSLFSNSGTVRASNGATASMTSANHTGVGGTYEALGAGSQIMFFDSRVENATFNGSGGGVIRMDAYNLGRLLELQDVVNQGLYQSADTNLLGSFQNSGEVQVLNAQTLAFESAFALTGGGTINLLQGGNIAGSFAMDNVDNTLAGFGSIDTTSSFGAASTIAPGTPSDATGIFDFNAPATFGGVIEIDLAGVGVNGGAPDINQVNRGTFAGGIEFDQLNILLNPVDLDSSVTFEIALATGFLPTLGDFFDILTADEIRVTSAPTFVFPTASGVDFTTQILTLFDPGAGKNRDVLRITAVPEPGPAALVLMGLAGLAGQRRRSKRADG